MGLVTLASLFAKNRGILGSKIKKLRLGFLKAMKNVAQVVLVLSIFGIPIAFPSNQVPNNSSPKRQGVPSSSTKNCPASHPIKGNFTTYSRERCIYHVPGQRFYQKTNPERCFATEEEAMLDGCRVSKV